VLTSVGAERRRRHRHGDGRRRGRRGRDPCDASTFVVRAAREHERTRTGDKRFDDLERKLDLLTTAYDDRDA
jgi:hypothetical protein